MNTGVIAESLKSVNFYLNYRDRQKALLLFVLLLVSSVLDVFGLASLIPIIMAASNPGSVFNIGILNYLYHLFGFQSERVFLSVLIIALFSFFLIKNIFVTWINHKQTIFSADIAVKIVASQFEKYTNLDFVNFNKLGSSFIINSVVLIPSFYVSGIIRPLFVLFSEITIIGVVLIGIIIYNPTLFLILAVTLVPATFLTYRFLRNRSQEIGALVNELKPKSFSLVTDTFVGYAELRLADKLNSFRNKILNNQALVQYLEAKLYLFSQLPLRIIEMVAILGVVTIFLYSLVLGENGQSIITIVGLFAAAAYRLMPSVNRLLTALVNLKQYKFAVDDLDMHREVLVNNLYKEQLEQEEIVFGHKIQLEDIVFRFPGADNPVLKNISLSIKKGEKVGFIGNSGSGKTTLFNLLLRFYKENSGQLLVDGLPVSDKNIKSWFQHIGYVKQDTFIMEGSFKNNITLGDENPDMARLDYAINQAKLRELVDGWPMGIETQIQERGGNLSGGQKQRIGIARALYKNASILILDEATSALDTETEKEVSEAINSLSHTEITILIIAHRITTLKECDRIFELKDGKIVGEHKYQDLIKQVA